MRLAMEYVIGFFDGVSFNTVAAATAAFGLVLFLLKNWIVERIKVSLQYDIRVREQVIKVAEYLAKARVLKKNDDNDKYIKLNQLSWELAIWLPEDIYNNMVRSIINPSEEINESTTVIEVRKLLLGRKAGGLTHEDIAVHGSDIGKKPPANPQ
jgi:hypothetical protein